VLDWLECDAYPSVRVSAEEELLWEEELLDRRFRIDLIHQRNSLRHKVRMTNPPKKENQKEYDERVARSGAVDHSIQLLMRVRREKG
jgi:hypothetical protein